MTFDPDFVIGVGSFGARMIDLVFTTIGGLGVLADTDDVGSGSVSDLDCELSVGCAEALSTGWDGVLLTEVLASPGNLIFGKSTRYI